MNQDEIVMNITHAVISAEITVNFLEKIKHTPYYKHDLKMHLNRTIKELVKYEAFYDEFFDTMSESTTEVYNHYESYIKAVSEVKIYEAPAIKTIIEAYRKDPKSIEGICKKVLRD